MKQAKEGDGGGERERERGMEREGKRGKDGERERESGEGKRGRGAAGKFRDTDERCSYSLRNNERRLFQFQVFREPIRLFLPL